jgi:hypothetical protein
MRVTKVAYMNWTPGTWHDVQAARTMSVLTLLVPSQEQIGKNVSIREIEAYISGSNFPQRHRNKQD